MIFRFRQRIKSRKIVSSVSSRGNSQKSNGTLHKYAFLFADLVNEIPHTCNLVIYPFIEMHGLQIEKSSPFRAANV